MNAKGLFVAVGLALYQLSVAQAPAQKYWVYFHAKPACETCTLAALFSPAAVARRARAGIPLAVSDLPISARAVAAVQATGAAVLHRSRWLNAVSAQLTPAQVAEVEALPQVRTVVPMRPYQRTLANEQSIATQVPTPTWHHSMLGINELHASGHTGAGVRVAVFDNGYRGVDTLPAFSGVFPARLLGHASFVSDTLSALATGGHGTAVFSLLAAASGDSIRPTAPDADYYLLRTEDDRMESLQEEDNWVAAAEWADSAGADIFQTSLGYNLFTTGGGSHSLGDLDGDTAPMTIAADLAAQKGILVINSAGNEGATNWERITVPADGDSVLAIGAVDVLGQRAPYSSTGPSNDGRIKPDLVAPGEGVWVVRANGYIAPGGGTSYAAPIISGLAACLKSAVPAATADQIRKALLQSANRREAPDNRYGYGLPNGPLALRYLRYATGAGIEEAPPEVPVVFPNPFSSTFTVAFPPATYARRYRVELFSATGQRLLKHTVKPVDAENTFLFYAEEFALPATEQFVFLRVTERGDERPVLERKLVVAP